MPLYGPESHAQTSNPFPGTTYPEISARSFARSEPGLLAVSPALVRCRQIMPVTEWYEPGRYTASQHVPDRHGTQDQEVVRHMEQDQEWVPGELVPETNIRHIGDAVRGWATDVLIRCAAGERYWYDTSMITMPAGPAGRVMTMTAVVIYTPSPLLDQPAIGAVRIIGDFPSKADVESAVRSAVEELRESRSSAMRRYIGPPVKDRPQA
jgi:hypothetical protein